MSFVCQNMPFINKNAVFIIPNIGLNNPFVFSCGKCTGFTLIEMMATLTVVAILIALGLPAMNSFIANQRLSTQVNDLLSDLAIARSEAIRRAAPVTICKTAAANAATPTCDATATNTWANGRLVFVDSDSGNPANNGNGSLDAGERIVKIRQALDGAITSANTAFGNGTTANGTVNRIVIGPNGSTGVNGVNALAAESPIFICDNRGDTQGRVVAIHPLGRARAIANKGKNIDGSNITACP